MNCDINIGVTLQKHQICIGFNNKYESGTKQKTKIPCGLCCSHCHDKNRCESITYGKTNLIWATVAYSGGDPKLILEVEKDKKLLYGHILCDRAYQT